MKPVIDDDLQDDIVCPVCHKHYEPNEVDPGNENSYIVGTYACGNCWTLYEVNTFTMYRTKKV